MGKRVCPYCDEHTVATCKACNGTALLEKLPQVRCKLVGEDGNTFAIMGRFQQAARRQGWLPEEIKKVLDKAMSGDYDNLLCVISEHCIDPDDCEEEDVD